VASRAHVDGDRRREVLSAGFGYSPASRLQLLNIERNHGPFQLYGGLQRAIGLFAALPLAGMTVGLGVRHRGSTEQDRLLRS
jgi:hypothetical protein